MTLGTASIKRLGILISGRGSNMVALAEAVQADRIPNAEIAIVISDQPNAAGLAKAQERGIETLVIERGGRAFQFRATGPSPVRRHSVDH